MGMKIEKNTNPSHRPVGRVLLVDDNEPLRAAVAEMIARADDLDVVASVGSAEEALVVFEASRPDLAVVDITLPGMNGLALLRTLKRHRPDLPVVVLSSLSPERMAPLALDAGAVAYLAKPQGFAELVSTIRLGLDPDSFLSLAAEESRAAVHQHVASA